MSAAKVLLAALALSATLGVVGQTPAVRIPRGIWPLARHDAQNTGRSDVPGRFAGPPVEVWRYGGLPPGYSFIKPVTVSGGEAFLRQVGRGLEMVRADGRTVWERPTAGVGLIIEVFDFGSPETAVVLATAGNNGYGLFEVATGKTLWTWTPPKDAYQGGYTFLRRSGGGRLFAFPQNTIEGHGFDFTKPGPPTEVWHERYPNTYWANFGPYPILADMDNDGREDILLAGKPSYFAVIDTDTGKIKFDIHYPVPDHEGTGRPYGLLQAVDIDGDGYRDAVMVSCQVEEYIGIVRNVGGRRFEYVWSRFIEHDLPDDFYELRPNITSFADVNGDGKREMVVGLYNIEGDKRWHTVVFDTMGGWQARLADLPDRYCWGCYDLDGDGRPEILTSKETARRTAPVSELHAVDGRSFEDVASIPQAVMSTDGMRLPKDRGFFGDRVTPVYAGVKGKEPGILLRRPGVDAQEMVWRIVNRSSVFEPLGATPVARKAMLDSGTGIVERPDLDIRERPRPASTGAYGPLVCVSGTNRELVMARTDLTIVGGTPDLAHSGRWKPTSRGRNAAEPAWTVRGSVPSVWQAPGGKRLICAMDWSTDRVYVYDPRPGSSRPEPMTTLKLPYPPVRSAGMLIPYGIDAMRLFVPLQTGVHTRAQAVYDADGKRIWFDEKEGPHPRQAALYRGSDGRLRFFVDNHGKHLIVDEGNGTARTVARGWYTEPVGRGDGAKYVLPIVGPYGPNRETRLVLSPGLENLEILDEKGDRLAKSAYGGIYERSYCASAMARIRGGPRWDVGMATHDGVFHSADAITALDRWTFDFGTKSSDGTRIASGDIDGDGRDNYVVGLPNGELVALDEKNGKGVVLWRMQFQTGVRDAIIADLDGDGQAEIIVETEDYSVRVLKPGRTKGGTRAGR